MIEPSIPVCVDDRHDMSLIDHGLEGSKDKPRPGKEPSPYSKATRSNIDVTVNPIQAAAGRPERNAFSSA